MSEAQNMHFSNAFVHSVADGLPSDVKRDSEVASAHKSNAMILSLCLRRENILDAEYIFFLFV